MAQPPPGGPHEAASHPNAFPSIAARIN
jgi:hypothetical protein